MNRELLKKYDVPAPRYTSYPTVPYWSDSPTREQWIEALQGACEAPDCSWSLYLHIPFCETLCTFCGCNNAITKNHNREAPYVTTLLKEWQLYMDAVPRLREVPLKHLHLGGGTPTFLSADHLEVLLKPMLDVTEHEGFEGSIEVDPRRTTREQLERLRQLGFGRVSMGVQDFDPEVQRLVNRIQPLEMTEKLTEVARELGYDSVNYDLIYGLPKQTPTSIADLAHKTVALSPDRIAFYSFAMVPWIRPAQRLFKDEDIPVGALKRDLYEVGREILLQAGYVEIGMDHFAKPSDALSVAQRENRLHRNFMGYTDSRTEILLGLGVSAISETPTCFHQNEKVLPKYEQAIADDQIATLRGHRLTAEDQFYREQILKLMTEWQVVLKDKQQAEDLQSYLQSMVEDELISISGLKLSILPAGRPFLRNACMGLDQRLRHHAPQTKVFSQSL